MDGTPSTKLNRSPVLFASILGAICLVFWIFLIPYAAGHGDGRERMITWLMRHWSTPTWLHGALVPFAALTMGWMSRDALRTAKIAPSPFGLVLLILGFLFLWAGYRTHVVYFGLAGIHGLVGGFILWFFGRAHFRIVLFPVLFMILAWPLPFLEASLSFHLRIWMTEMSGGLLNLFGSDVVRQGTALVWDSDSGPVFMEIEGACSGLRSLFSLLAAAALLGFFTLRRPADRAIIVLAAIPLAIAGNIVRIVALYLGIHLWGWETAVGSADSPSTFHLFAGTVAIAVGIAGIALLATGLRRRGRKQIRTKVGPISFPSTEPTHAGGGNA